MTQKMVLIPYVKYERLIKDNGKSEAIVEECPSSDSLDEDIILAMIPSNLHSRVKSLLSTLSTFLCWNKNGEIYLNEHSVTGSHIADLLRACVYNYKNCEQFTGMDDFCKILAQNNVPLTLFGNVKLRSKIEMYRCKRNSCENQDAINSMRWISL